ncbi:MAG: hypothetical protein KIH69_003110 [Anaerolineae bacterium]|nr:hypothetical protein [Anaerolineae bacterium]
MNHRIRQIERQIGRKNDENNAIVAIICDDGTITANGKKHANQAKFTRFCAKNGITTVLFLPDNGRDKPK